ncbi:hypothetical protein QQ045_022312 [Rhodiola kirilowii]
MFEQRIAKTGACGSRCGLVNAWKERTEDIPEEIDRQVPLMDEIDGKVLDDKGYNGTTSDVWSCGIILFVLMAGYLPFDEANIIQLYKKNSQV